MTPDLSSVISPLSLLPRVAMAVCGCPSISMSLLLQFSLVCLLPIQGLSLASFWYSRLEFLLVFSGSQK